MLGEKVPFLLSVTELISSAVYVLYVCAHPCVCVCVCMYVCMCVCVVCFARSFIISRTAFWRNLVNRKFNFATSQVALLVVICTLVMLMREGRFGVL